MADSLDKGVLLCVNPNLTLSQPSGRDRGFPGGPWLRLLGRSVMGKLLARAVGVSRPGHRDHEDLDKRKNSSCRL